MKDINEEKKQLVALLVDTYSTIILSRKQAAGALNVSTATLDRMKTNGVGPAYSKTETVSQSKNGRVSYPVTAIAEYMVSSQIKCVSVQGGVS